MPENNYAYMVEQLENRGFGRDPSLELLNKITAEIPQFTIRQRKYYGDNEVRATLQFNKSDKSAEYIFKSYKLEVINKNNTLPVRQTFYINEKDERAISLEEAYNLLQGRAIQKELSNAEGAKNQTWMQLDFKNTDENSNYVFKKFDHNYDLVAILNKLPIKELEEERSQKNLIESLQKGNRELVMIQHNGTIKKVYIEAVPKFNSVTIYDTNMRRITCDISKPKQQQESQSQNEKATHNQAENRKNSSLHI